MFFLYFVVTTFCMAQKAVPVDSLTVWGNVRDVFTNEWLADVRIEAVSPADGKIVAVDSCRDRSRIYVDEAGRRFKVYQEPAQCIYYSLRMVPGEYLLRLIRKGYAVKEQTVVVPGKINGRKLKKWKAEDIAMRRTSERELGEAVVTATKVMMVHKGDTLVFNADYFQLAQGNMLDKLISMIPGLDIKDGGQITYQGNRLETLLVNGKDFFKGDASVALQNLPAYVVNTVNIYHKDADDAYLQARKDSTDRKPNTIDIKLKKQYNQGTIANFEMAGGPALGTDDNWGNAKYLARLFGMYFFNRGTLAVMGNFNNINDSQTASGDGSWRKEWQPDKGETKMEFAGLNMNVTNRKKDVSNYLDFRFAHETTDVQSNTSGTTFLPTGDVFSRATFTGHNPRRHYAFNENLSWRHRKFYLGLPLAIEYWHRRAENNSLSAQFSADPYDSYRGAAIDSIFVGPNSQRLQNILINKVEQRTQQTLKDLTVDYRPSFSVKIPGLELLWHTRLTLSYNRQRRKNFEHYRVAYQDPTGGERLNRYFEMPSQAFDVNLSSRVTFGELFLNPFLHDLFSCVEYSYVRKHLSGRRRIYDLHRLPEEEEPQELGGLPSMNGWREQTIDMTNSYFQRKTENVHSIRPTFYLGNAEKGGRLSLIPGYSCYRQEYSDTRSGQRVEKRYGFFGLDSHYSVYRIRKIVSDTKADELRRGFSMNYTFRSTPPLLSYLLDVRDDSDPLHVSLGNARLRSPRVHGVWAEYSHSRWKSSWRIKLEYNRRNDEIAMGCVYNPTNGVYTYRPENVNGNWNTNVRTHYYKAFGTEILWNFTTSASWDYNHSVDLVDGRRSVVHNHLTKENLSLQARFGKVATASLRANMDWYHATSARENYRTRNTFDLYYGPDLNLHLPGDLSVSTDLNVYQRCGYDDRSMNDCDFVWNLSLGWDFDFRRSSYYSYEVNGFIRMPVRGGTGARPWTLRLVCHDLLHQLSDTRRVINAQGITETHYNAAPAYVMLSISYRFSKIPKKDGMH